MNSEELETMRKSFDTVKERSSKLKFSKDIIALEKNVQNIKNNSVENREELIGIAIESFKRNGIEVLKAETAADACNLIYELVKDIEPKVIAKAKSNTLGEINIKQFLTNKGFDVIETDLGDRILQLKKTDNKPVHPTGPASHLNVNQISDIVSEAFGEEINPNPKEIMEAVKEDILKNLESSLIGISGANVIAAKEGSIVLVHNEGNISLVTLKDLHIIVAGIDKFVESLEDAISIAKLETVYATGSYVTSYINVVSGPSKTADIEKKLLKNMYGAEKVILILLDNGRSTADDDCLLCIGCGNCIIHCPVYNTIGNKFGYNNYLGGRGVAMSKFIGGNDICYSSGIYKCTLCGLCTLNCPVSIPTNEIIEKIRKELVDNEINPHEHSKISENISKNDSPF